MSLHYSTTVDGQKHLRKNICSFFCISHIRTNFAHKFDYKPLIISTIADGNRKTSAIQQYAPALLREKQNA